MNTGEPLARELALVLSSDIARVLEKFSIASLDSLKSVVFYPTGLPVESGASALLMVQAPQNYLDRLEAFGTILEMVDAAQQIYRSTEFEKEIREHGEVRMPEVQFLARKKKGRKSHSLYKPNTGAPIVHHMERFQNSYAELSLELQKWKSRFESVISEKHLHAFEKFLIRFQEFVHRYYSQEVFELIVASLSKSKESYDIEGLPSVEEPQSSFKSLCDSFADMNFHEQYSLHLSWSGHLNSLISDGRSDLIHELAHLVDFQFVQTFHPVRHKQWTKMKERLEAEGSMLNEYAFQDNKEFFAVSSEYFFRDPEKLKAEHPKLFHKLKHSYQKTPTPCGPRSQDLWKIAISAPLYEHVDKAS